MIVLALARAVGGLTSGFFFSVVAAFARCLLRFIIRGSVGKITLLLRVVRMLGTVGQVLMMSRLLSKIGVVTALVVGMIGITTVVTALMVGVVTALVAGITMGGARMTTGDPCGDQAALRPDIIRLGLRHQVPQSRLLRRLRQRLHNVPKLPVWCGERSLR